MAVLLPRPRNLQHVSLMMCLPTKQLGLAINKLICSLTVYDLRIQVNDMLSKISQYYIDSHSSFYKKDSSPVYVLLAYLFTEVDVPF